MGVHIGCCGFPVRQVEYWHQFKVVEIQETFYNLPRVNTVERWRAEAPTDARFTLKAPQLITHEPTSPTYRRLRRQLSEREKIRYGSFRPTQEIREAWTRTLALATTLRAPMVLFQCPASFDPTAAHVKHMEQFFHEIDRGTLTLAWEPRGEWPDETVKKLCKKLNLLHCVDPFTRKSVWGEFSYFRLHGRNGYSYVYTVEDFRELAGYCLERPTIYCFFNNVNMWHDARYFEAILGKGGSP